MPRTRATREYLVASDFDQTLSFNDSGIVLGELLGAHGFEERVKGLAHINLVQQGGELAYLLLHDPEYRKVRREHLVEVGRRIRLKPNIGRLVEILERGIDGHRFSFYVVSAAPEEVVQSALAGLVPAERIRGTRFEYDQTTGEIRRVERVCAGYGKVAALAELQEQLGVSPDHVVYVGDGSSDVHVMLHVNSREGHTIAVSENKQLARIARSTVLSEDAFSVMVPILDRVLGWPMGDTRALFARSGLRLEGWEKGAPHVNVSAAAAGEVST